MNRRLILKRAYSGILIGVAMSNVTFAGYPDSYDIEQSSHDLVKQCNHLMYSKSDDVCAGDVGMATAYIDSATRKVRQQNYLQALTAIKYGEHELRAITKRSYCRHFSTEIKPMIKEAIQIGSAIETLERQQRLNVAVASES